MYHSRLIPGYTSLWLKRFKVQSYLLQKTKGKVDETDILSKKRIWQKILQKSIEDLKRNEIDTIREDNINLQQQVITLQQTIESMQR